MVSQGVTRGAERRRRRVLTYLALELDLLVVAVRHVPLGQPRLPPEGSHKHAHGQLVIAPCRAKVAISLAVLYEDEGQHLEGAVGALERGGGARWCLLSPERRGRRIEGGGRAGSTLEESCGSVRPGHFSVQEGPAAEAAPPAMASEAWRGPAHLQLSWSGESKTAAAKSLIGTYLPRSYSYHI